MKRCVSYRWGDMDDTSTSGNDDKLRAAIAKRP